MADTFGLYSKQVMRYFVHPKNMGIIEKPDAVAIVGNPRCGDVMKVYIRVVSRSKIKNPSNTAGRQKSKIKIMEDYVKDIKVQILGCGAAIATSSIATEMVKGKSLNEAMKLSNKMIIDKLGGLPKAKYHCSILAEQGIKQAIKKYRRKNKK